MLKAMYAVLGLPKKQRGGGLTTLHNIRAAAEREPRPTGPASASDQRLAGIGGDGWPTRVGQSVCGAVWKLIGLRGERSTVRVKMSGRP
jgi:hypothetical protein